MSVQREVTLEFDGQSYVFVPSMQNLRAIDQSLLPANIISVVFAGPNVSLPLLSFIIAQVIRKSGGFKTEDEVYEVLYKDLTQNGQKQIANVIAFITDCVSPPEDSTAKNSSAPAETGAKKTTKTKRKA